MCPQLLSQVNRKATVIFGHDSLMKKPKLAPYVANVISAWSYSDAAYATMVTHFLRADFRIVHEMFHVLRSSDARRQIIQAAANEALHGEDKDIFNAVRKCTNTSRTKRNDFAHCLWGTSLELPDALLLASPKVSTEYDVYLATVLSGQMQNSDEEMLRFRDQYSRIYVYRENDLIREANEAIWACRQINLLLVYLSRSHTDAREQARNQLLEEPRIRDYIANLSQQNSPESQPQSQPQEPPEKQ